MCDYSLQGIRNRLAEQGETLVVHRFQTGSKGLTSREFLCEIDEPKTWLGALKKLFATHSEECAVCIPDGARLLLTGFTPGIQRQFGLSSTEPVTFRQLSADAATYRDAVEFKNGVKLRIQDLEEGQTAFVLALSSEEIPVAAPEEAEFPEGVDSRAWIHRSPW
jgi:hypothetical protein